MKTIKLIIFFLILVSIAAYSKNQTDKINSEQVSGHASSVTHQIGLPNFVVKITDELLLDHGIKMVKKEYRSKGDKWIDHTDAVFTQNGKVIDTFSSQRISKVYHGDLDNDGIQELILEGYSGGAHCCFEIVIIPLLPRMNKIDPIGLNNASLSVKDLDGDGESELIMYDDLYSYFESLCYACSPGVNIAVNYKKGKLTLNSQLTKKLNHVLQTKLQLTQVHVDIDRMLRFKDEGRASDSISHFLHYLYTGQYSRGVSVLDRYFVDGTPAAKAVLHNRLMDIARESRFWEEIKAANRFTLQQLAKMRTGESIKELEADSFGKNIPPQHTERLEKVIKSGGIVIKIDYPKRVDAGEEFIVKAEMLNGVKNARMGGLTLSFPQFKSMKFSTVSKKFDNLTAYRYPQKMYNRILKKNIRINHFSIEGWESKWKFKSTRYMKLKFKAPYGMNTIDISVRGVIVPGKGRHKREIINPKNRRVHDQQGYPVEQIHIKVN